MGKFATGITIVTLEDNHKILEMTVNAFMSVSLEPKLIAISIDESASVYEELQETDKFGISILSTEQQNISMYFAKQIEEVTINYEYRDGVPILQDALATIICRKLKQVTILSLLQK
ncbi:flavin reductase family protein [Ornithinibacillus sp. 4-3]|uniref:Flavin reductase family protein n=1 Tax=Ornithinibacillus sp. 4-3 TaxID=3231488 RepID=A0AB39HSY4_9BACI